MKIIYRYKFNNWKKNTPESFIQYLFSPTSVGLRIINLIYQKFFGINGRVKFMVHYTSQVSGNIILGKGVVQSFCNSGNCYIQGINGISIGDNTIFAPGVKIISSNHNKSDLSEQEYSKPIKIGKNCWIGTNAVLLPGVQIGDNTVVGAGAVVTKSFPINSIIVGNPAKPINTND